MNLWLSPNHVRSQSRTPYDTIQFSMPLIVIFKMPKHMTRMKRLMQPAEITMHQPFARLGENGEKHVKTDYILMHI